ncbi:MAG: DUF2169 domain-containing protein [Planctomycetota bacterium]
MWDIDNKTPFHVRGSFIRDHTVATFWLVHIKASFVMRPDQKCLFATDQVPLHASPIFFNDDPQSDLLADVEVVPLKALVDVVVDATGYPPAGCRDAPYIASVSIGGWEKRLQVNAPVVYRRWGGVAKDSSTFNGCLPLRYTQSFGGPDSRLNPIGHGHAKRRTDMIGQAVPRLSPADEPYRNPTEERPGVGFSGIPTGWPERVRFAGTYDDEWMRRRAPLFPADLDLRFWQSVAADQQLPADAVMGQELMLTNMTSSDGLTATPPMKLMVPSLDFEIHTRFSGNWSPLTASVQAIELSVDSRRLSLTFAAALPIGAAQHDVRVKETVVSMRGHDGFVVAPSDIRRFTANDDDPEVEAVAP